MPYKDPEAHQQVRILIPKDAYEELKALSEAEERSMARVAGRLIREALAARQGKRLPPLP